MSLLALAFEENSAHVAAVVGLLTGVLLAVRLGQGPLGLAVVVATAWLYVLGYLAYVWRRYGRHREPEWTGTQRLVALGALVAEDSRVGTAPLPVTVVGLVGAAATLWPLWGVYRASGLPPWTISGLLLPIAPLLLPVALGRTAYRLGRVRDDLPPEL